MTPKEKAKYLVDNYYQLAESIEWTDDETKVKAEQFNDELGSDVLNYWHKLAKESALIAVDEILKHEEYIINKIKYSFAINGISVITKAMYWQQVKQEIEKL